MAPRKKKATRKKRAKKQTDSLRYISRLCTGLFLLFMLIFSVCAAGYVIFFRTAFAGDSGAAKLADLPGEQPEKPVQAKAMSNGVAATNAELPKVAIIIDDIGYDELVGEKLLSHPLTLTYSFLPFAPYTEKLQRRAHLAGKSILLHLPLEPKSKDWDPGPGALLLGDSPELQTTKLQQCLDAVPHAVGINTHMGSLYTENREAMHRLLREIGRRSLLFVDSFTSAGSVGLLTARKQGIASGRRHVFLDNVATVEKICEQLATLVRLAEQQGWGIGIAHPRHVTVDAISTCAESFLGRVHYVSVEELLRPAAAASLAVSQGEIGVGQ